MNIRNILVATDLDDSTRPIYAYAAAIAHAMAARVTLLHVDQIGAQGFHGSDDLNAYIAQIHEVLSTRLAEAAEAIEDAGVICGTVIRQGRPAQQILEAIEDEAADLLVIAKRKEGPLSEFVVGSTTRRLMRRSPIPVLAVDIFNASETPRLERLVTTTDHSEDSTRGQKVAEGLAEALEAQLDVVNVFQWPLYVPNAPGHPSATLPPPALEDLRGYYEQELKEARKAANEGGHAVVVDPDVAHGVVSYCRRREADLIIIPTHGKGAVRASLLGSTSEKVVETAGRPVLILPRRWLEALDG